MLRSIISALGLNEIALSSDRVSEGIEILLLQCRHAVSVGLSEVAQERGHALGCGLGWAESNDWVSDHEPLLFWPAFLWFRRLFGHCAIMLAEHSANSTVIVPFTR